MKQEPLDPFLIDIKEIDQIYLHHSGEGCFMPQTEWEPLVRKAYAELINRAITISYNQITTTYSQLGSKIGLTPISDWFHLKIAWILYACATLAYNRRFPLITALVVNSKNGKPGKGFWGLNGIPQQLYIASRREDDTSIFNMDDARDLFWVEELKRIDKWGKNLKIK